MTTSQPRISIVVAMTRNRVIGRDNSMPWHLPADLARFKKLTLDKPIVMGRNTWESLPGLLPRRSHIVITRNPSYHAEGCCIVHSPEEAIKAAGDVPEVMVIGGDQIYREMLPMADRIYVTIVGAVLRGNKYFPKRPPDQWRSVKRMWRPRDKRNRYDLAFITFDRQST